MIYLASPYSAVGLDWTSRPAVEIRERRYNYTMFAQAQLFSFGYPIFCTIVHTHVTAKVHKLPTDAEYWKRFNHHMIDLSRAVFVLELDGWEESIGVKDEIDYAYQKAIPCYRIMTQLRGDHLELEIPIVPDLMTMTTMRNPPSWSIATTPVTP